MRKSLVIVACLGLMLAAACTGRPPHRCDQWGWYQECDLVEGREALRCDPCSPCGGYPGYQPGQVVRREWAYPAAPCAAPAVPAAPVPALAEPLPAPAVAPGPLAPPSAP